MSKYTRKTNKIYHGLSHTKIHWVWGQMRARCTKPRIKNYNNYGGRGIRVCPEWEDFLTFYNWAMAAGYREGLSIERINNDGDYCPENCAFVDRVAQSNNRRNNVRVEILGEHLTFKEISDKYKISRPTLRRRYYENGLRGQALISTINTQNGLSVMVGSRERRTIELFGHEITFPEISKQYKIQEDTLRHRYFKLGLRGESLIAKPGVYTFKKDRRRMDLHGNPPHLTVRQIDEVQSEMTA